MSVIRRAGPADEDDLVQMVREFYELDQHPFHLDRVLSGLRPLLVDDALGQVWVVVDPEGVFVPAGYVVLTWGWSLESGGREALLDEFYLRGRGQGLGTKALADVIKEAAAAGAATVFLETEAHNQRSRIFFGKAGFALEDSVWMSVELLPRS